MENTATALLEQASALLAEVAAMCLPLVDDDAVVTALRGAEQVGRLADTIRVQVAAEVDDRSRFGLGSDGLASRLGQRRGLQLVTSVTRVSEAEAARRIRLGGAIRQRVMLDGQVLPANHPHVAAAMVAGTMGVEAAASVVRCLDQAARRCREPEQLDRAEFELAAASAHDTADSIAFEARVWRELLDQDGAEPRDAELRDRRAFFLGRERNGMTPFSGACDPVSAALLRAAFTESNAPDAAPRFLSDEDAACAEEPLTTPGEAAAELPRDPRSREQRQLDVLIGLVTAGLRSTGMRSTATVMAVVTLDDLKSGTGVGWLDDVDEPVSAATIRELACDAGFRRILLGNDGEVIALGRLERYFTPSLRRALAVRDGGCAINGCSAPPARCHAHHVTEWANGGPTDVDNGVLLCPAHHHWLHSSEHTMKMIDGIPHLLAPPWIDPEQVWRPQGRSRTRILAGLRRAS